MRWFDKIEKRKKQRLHSGSGCWLGGLRGRFTSRPLRVQVVAWGRRRGLALASCRFATCFAGFPGQPVSQLVTSIAVLLNITSSNHQHHHTSRGGCRYQREEEFRCRICIFRRRSFVQNKRNKERSQRRPLVLFTSDPNRRNVFFRFVGHTSRLFMWGFGWGGDASLVVARRAPLGA